ncbi:MAG: LysM peptidoglycan-binding domain-containing protein [Chloroflexi bacterium]|jgi:LysM repeat protein|nr:LysM peptidoglycan-binding domain-containing protein [Chloroflexota bacterium]
MPKNNSPQSVINSYRRRQRMTPFIIGGLAVTLAVVGIIVLVIWLNESGSLSLSKPLSLFATDTPTPTNTATATPVTPTITPTNTATETVTPTVTETATPSGPFEYTVQEGDNCYDIASQFDVDLPVLLAINNFGEGCPIQVGQNILVPSPNQSLPTTTPIPADVPSGTEVTYAVTTGDSLAAIAISHGTTVEAIMEDNELEEANTIFVGQILIIRVNLVTQVPSPFPTTTVAATVTP